MFGAGERSTAMQRCEQCEIMAAAFGVVVKGYGNCLDVLKELLTGTVTEARLIAFIQENARHAEAIEMLKAQLEAVAVKNGALS